MISLKDLPSDDYEECDGCGDEAVISIQKRIFICVDCAKELGEALIDL